MPARPRSVIGRVVDGGLRDVGGGRDRDGRHSVGHRGRVRGYIRVKALSRVGALFKRRPRKAQRPQRCVRRGRRGTSHGDGVGFRGAGSVRRGDRNCDRVCPDIERDLMPARPRSVIGRVVDGGLRDVGGGRDRDGRHSVGHRGRVRGYIRVKALSRVGALFKRRPRKAQRPQRCVRGLRLCTGHGDGVGFRVSGDGGDRNPDRVCPDSERDLMTAACSVVLADLRRGLVVRDRWSGRNRDSVHSIGDRGRVRGYIRVKALSRVGFLFKRRPIRKAQRLQRRVRGLRLCTGYGDGVGFRVSGGGRDPNRDRVCPDSEGDLMPIFVFFGIARQDEE